MKREPRPVTPRSPERAKALHNSMNYSLGRLFGVPVAAAIDAAAVKHAKRRGRTKITIQPEEP